MAGSPEPGLRPHGGQAECFEETAHREICEDKAVEFSCKQRSEKQREWKKVKENEKDGR